MDTVSPGESRQKAQGKMRPMRSFAILSANLEAFLSTHAFSLLFLIFYLTCTALMFVWGFTTQWKKTDNEAMIYFISIARGAGYSLNLNTSLVILIAARLTFTLIRETPLQYILPLDKIFPLFHMFVGYMIAFLVLIHGTFHMTWIIRFQGWNSGLWGFTMSFVTGFIILPVFVVMLITSLPHFRKNKFRLFYLFHLYGAALFFFILIFHGMYFERPETYKWITPSLIIYLLDRFIRRMKISSHDLDIALEKSILKDGDILELRVPKPFDYRPGHYAEVMVPSINKEWHPFSIASAPHEETMCFYIKVLGDWTTEVRNAFKARLDGTITEPLKVRVRGPYGAPCQDVDGFKRVVLVSGGVGATPFSAIVKELHYLKTQAKNKNDGPGRIARDIDVRIRDSIANLYDVEVQDMEKATHIAQQKSIYVTEMLELTARRTSSLHRVRSSVMDRMHGSSSTKTVLSTDAAIPSLEDGPVGGGQPMSRMQRLSSSLSKAGNIRRVMSTLSENPVTWDQVMSAQNDPLTNTTDLRRQMARLYDKRGMLLAFMHTARFTFFLLLTLIVRIIIISVAATLDSPYFQLNDQFDGYTRLWPVVVDALFSVPVAAALVVSITLEISFMRLRFFDTAARTFDAFALLPAAVIGCVLAILTWARQVPESVLVKVIEYVLFIPLLFLGLSWRLYRITRSRSLLSDPACRCDNSDHIPDVDFIWSFPYEQSDQWLQDELGPLAKGTELRLHRYVTREKELDVEAAKSFITSANTGRPKWDDIFQTIAEETPSNGAIGVFFCGPHVMGNQVRDAMLKVEVLSNLRAAYLRNTPDEVLMTDLNLPNAEAVERLRSLGCSVHFVYREENFG